MFAELLDRNPGEDRAIYLQISRGVYAKRDLTTTTPDNTEVVPTIFAMVLQLAPPNIDVSSAGITAITVEDFRWDACDIKSTSLLANVILRHQAIEAKVNDAILLKNGVVTEGTASNVFIVKDGVLVTPPTGNQLLAGITRDLVIEIAENNNILVEQRMIKEAELLDADEIWMTSSTREIAPVISLNGKAVGDGVAGKVWKRIVDLYQQHKQILRQQ
jgi:D-alanine transaminase